jgi:hypothetical protein
MTYRPKCNFCQKKSDIIVTENDKSKTYYCGGCYLKKKLNYYEVNSRPRNQRISRQR